MNRIRKRRIKRLCIVMFFVIGIGSCIVWGLIHLDHEEDKKAEDVLQEQEEVPVVSYISETKYGDCEPIDKEVFSYPFRKTNQYVANKDFIDSLSDEDIERVLNDGNVFLQSLLNSSFRDVVADEQGFKDRLCELFAGDYLITDGDEEISTQAFAGKIAEWYAENHVKIDMESESNKALIWKDNYLYVRYLITLTLYSCEDTEFLEELIGYPLNVGETRKFVLDLALANSGEKYRVAGWEIVGNYPKQ